MKAILLITDSNGGITSANVVPDSAVTRCRDPFFVPDNRTWCALPLQGARIDRLGKGISARFASRYYSGIVTAAHIYCDNASSDPFRYGRDGALVVTDPVPADNLPDDVAQRIDRAIETVSAAITLKTGDLVLFPDPSCTTAGISKVPDDIMFTSGSVFPPLKLKIR